MAAFSQSSIDMGSDFFQDFLCSTCEDKKLDKMAEFYCGSCVKFYCGNCISMHSHLFTKHAPFGRGEMKKWPVAKKVEDFLLKCDVHKEENLTMFCDNHSELCCTNCAFLNHRHCNKVTLISDKLKSQSKDLQQLSVSIQTILETIKKLQDNKEASFRSVQSSYDEQLNMIQETRNKINAALNMIEQKTMKEMKDILTKLQASTKSDVDECIRLRDELKQLRDAIQDISDKSKLELSFIATRKCGEKIHQSETFLKKNSLQVNSSIIFLPNSDIVQYLSQLSGLGKIEHSNQPRMVQENPNMVFAVKGKSEQDVKISSDLPECSITAICVLPDRQVLVIDTVNETIKLLDEQFQVMSICDVSDPPLDICLIAPSEVAVAIDNGDSNTHEVQFITVNNGQLLIGRKPKLQHTIIGIACHKGSLFITSRTALYKYTLSGKQISKMYEDTSERHTVCKCAFSPTGDKLYITNFSRGKLLTLARDGSVLATFTDPAAEGIFDVDVTPAGQVLVCAYSGAILQVDIEGRRKLAILATSDDGLVKSRSVCYNRHTSSIIVGRDNNSSILVFKVE